jgi:hypothetical protein
LSDRRKFEAEKYFPTEWHEGIRKAIKEGISDGLAEHCRLPISDNECQQVRFLFDGIRALGKGDLHDGIDRLFSDHKWVIERAEDEEKEENHTWAEYWRKKMGRMSDKIGTTVIGIFVALIFMLFGYGIKELVESWLQK